MKTSLAARCAVAGLAIAAVAVPTLAGGRQKPFDPFVDQPKRNTPVVKPAESIIAPPALAARQKVCKDSVPASKVQNLPCMYLVGELKLPGVFRSEDQPEALLSASPTKQTVTVHVGDKLFDGHVVSIVEPGPADNGTVVLEKVVKKQVGKKVTEEKESVTLQLSSAGF